MDDQTLKGLLSKLIPDEIENRLGLSGGSSEEQNTRAVELLKTAAGQAGGGMENEMNDFLNGRGALLETTRSAVARGGSSAVKEVAAFLTSQLHLSAPLAKLIAPLLIQLFPAIGKLTGTSATEKPKKPRRKKKKEDSSAKPASAHKPKKPKPSSTTKPAASHKPKKPKASSSGKPKKTRSSSAQPKRALEIDLGQEE